MKHLKECFITFSNSSKFVKNYSATFRIFTSLLSVWKCDEALSLSVVFDVVHGIFRVKTK